MRSSRSTTPKLNILRYKKIWGSTLWSTVKKFLSWNFRDPGRKKNFLPARNKKLKIYSFDSERAKSPNLSSGRQNKEEAVSRIVASSMSHLKWFQLFHPICGVLSSPFSSVILLPYDSLKFNRTFCLSCPFCLYFGIRAARGKIENSKKIVERKRKKDETKKKSSETFRQYNEWHGFTRAGWRDGQNDKNNVRTREGGRKNRGQHWHVDTSARMESYGRMRGKEIENGNL